MEEISKLVKINKKILDWIDTDVKQTIHDRVKTQPGFKDTCLIIFAKSTKSFRAIQQLCNNGIGYGEDAIIIVRSLLEHLISLAYIVNPQKDEEREHRAKLFRNWLVINLKRKIDKFPDDDSLKPQLEQQFKKIESIGANYEEINKLHIDECKKRGKNSKRNWSWCGLSLGEMAKEIESSMPETKLYSLYYNKVYWSYSKIAHPDL